MTSWTLPFVLFFAADFLLSSCVSPKIATISKPEVLARGQNLISRGHSKEAAKFFESELAKTSNCPDFYYGLGNAYACLEKYDDALTQFNRVIELDPAYEAAYHDRGNVYLSLRLYSKAIEDYDQAIKIDARKYGYWYSRFDANRRAGNLAQARMDATEVISRIPDSTSGYILRARAEKALHLDREAAKDLKMAVSKRGERASSNVAVGDYLWDAGQVAEALKYYTEYSNLAPTSGFAHEKKAECEMALGMLEAARIDLDIGTKLVPQPDCLKSHYARLRNLEYDEAHKATSLPIRWGLACTALTFTRNHNGLQSLAGESLTTESRKAQAEVLADSWGVHTREQLQQMLDDLSGSTGHNSSWNRYVNDTNYLTTISHMAEANEDVVDGTFFRRAGVVEKYGSQLGSRGILAWDLCRYICLVRWGYTVGFVSATEAEELIIPVAKRLQNNYGSWKQMSEEYLIGRRFWHEKRWKIENEEYDRIMKMLLTQKNSPWVTIPWETDLSRSD